MLKTLTIIVFYASISGLAAWAGSDLARQYGFFGPCGYERSCMLEAAIIGFPSLWFPFFVLLFLARSPMNYGMLTPLLDGKYRRFFLFGFIVLSWILSFASLIAIVVLTELFQPDET